MSKIELTPYQEDLKQRLQNQHGMVVSFGLGSGKTIASIAAADQFGPARVVTPASLRENFKKELKVFKPKHKFSVESYERFIKTPEDLTGKTLIVDEAHRLKTNESARSQAVQQAARTANKVLLLTGTPIVNSPSDISPLINAAAGGKVLPTSEKEFNARYLRHVVDNPGTLRRLFGAKPKNEMHPINLQDFAKRTKPFIMFNKGVVDPSIPTVKEYTIPVEMSPLQSGIYKILEKQLPVSVKRTIEAQIPPTKKDISALNAFLSNTRQVSNDVHKFVETSEPLYSPKLKSIVSNVLNTKGKSLIYSNYLDSGVKPLSELLSNAKVSHGIFTGNMTDLERKNLIKAYNADKIKALIVSSAGGEGLDLKGTRAVHLTEPHWHDVRLSQTVGRAVRKGSHAALPPEERNVDVYKYQSLLPSERSGFLWMHKSRPISADQYLDNLAAKKKALNDEFLSVLSKTASSRREFFVDAMKTIGQGVGEIKQTIPKDPMTRRQFLPFAAARLASLSSKKSPVNKLVGGIPILGDIGGTLASGLRSLLS